MALTLLPISAIFGVIHENITSEAIGETNPIAEDVDPSREEAAENTPGFGAFLGFIVMMLGFIVVTRMENKR